MKGIMLALRAAKPFLARARTRTLCSSELINFTLENLFNVCLRFCVCVFLSCIILISYNDYCFSCKWVLLLFFLVMVVVLSLHANSMHKIKLGA